MTKELYILLTHYVYYNKKHISCLLASLFLFCTLHICLLSALGVLLKRGDNGVERRLEPVVLAPPKPSLQHLEQLMDIVFNQ